MSALMGRSRSATLVSVVFWALAAITPLAAFWRVFHWQILIPTRTHWLLAGDWGQGLIGWTALRHDVWRWPLGVTKLLAWPTGVAITYTDSNPLFSVLLKPFAGLLPEPFQFVGWWFLACWVLQFWAAFLLLRHATADRWLRLAGAALFTLTPTLINRIGHANLCAHWTILLALHLYLNVERPARRDLAFAALLTVCALVHPYLLLMCAAIWGSDVLRRAWPLLRGRDLRGLGAFAARCVAILAAPVLALWATGGLGGYAGDAGGFGFYSMGLDAPFNPGRAGFSRFLPWAPQDEGQTFEGFQYLGAGVLLLLAVGLAGAWAAPPLRRRLKTLSWLAWLAPALVVLWLLALSNEVQLFDHHVARIDYDWVPFHLTSTFRASGRLFWPCAYMLMLLALELVFAFRRTTALALILLGLAVQLVDQTSFAPSFRSLTAGAQWRKEQWVMSSSKRWEPLIRSAKVVEFQPLDPHREGLLFYEIAFRSASMGVPINIMYTARTKPEQQAYEQAARGRFIRGELDPTHLYVITDGCVPAGVPIDRVKMVNWAMVIPPEGARYAFDFRPAPPPQPFPVGETVVSSKASPLFRCRLGQDWSVPDDQGVWSDGPAPDLIFNLAASPTRDLVLTIAAHGYPDEGQGVTVMSGDRPLGRLQLTAQPGEYRVRIPFQAAAGGTLHLKLAVDRPTAPSSRSSSSDSRHLGVYLTALRLDPAS